MGNGNSNVVQHPATLRSKVALDSNSEGLTGCLDSLCDWLESSEAAPFRAYLCERVTAQISKDRVLIMNFQSRGEGVYDVVEHVLLGNEFDDDYTQGAVLQLLAMEFSDIVTGLFCPYALIRQAGD